MYNVTQSLEHPDADAALLAFRSEATEVGGPAAVLTKAQIPLCRLTRDVRDEPVTSHLAQIPLRRLPRNFPVRGSRDNGIWAYVDCRRRRPFIVGHVFSSTRQSSDLSSVAGDRDIVVAEKKFGARWKEARRGARRLDRRTDSAQVTTTVASVNSR